MKVLVIEDDPDVQSWLKDALASAGHEIRLADDGKQGLQMLRDQTPDVVLLDILMPEMDGIEVLRELRSKESPPKIIAISGAPGDWAVLNIAEKLGASKTLTKPFTLRELNAAIEAVLTGR